ncbi:hypothetical protein BKA69DRAFT_415202 [Paraphysoderma sedebokerense]|nr:hypothetical protein BKA69DRAFT_415202 [Paraphysoderma sedebokerense]
MEDEKFKLSKLRHNAERLAGDLDPLLDVVDAVREVIRWDKPIKTSVIATLYFYLLYANLLLSVSLLTMIFIISYYGVRRREAAHSLGLGCLVHDAAEEPRFSILTQRRIQEEKEAKTSKLSVRRFLPGADDWWTEIQDHFLAFLQLQLRDTADLVEKLRNLVTWKNPRRTWEVVGLLAFGVVGISYVPPGLVLKSIGFFIGVELFLLLPLQLHFPRYRRMFSLMHLLLWDIPTDEEYRIQEYTRLSHRHDEIEFSNCGCGTQSQNSLGSTDTIASDQADGIVGFTGPDVLPNGATDSTNSLDTTFTQADSPKNAVKEYDCDFNSKSGILHLYPSYLSFESSKLPTSVSIPYSKIVRLKKVRVWSSIYSVQIEC